MRSKFIRYFHTSTNIRYYFHSIRFLLYDFVFYLGELWEKALYWVSVFLLFVVRCSLLLLYKWNEKLFCRQIINLPR